MGNEYTYDGEFHGNILVVGRTGCGKTTFIQKLGKNKLFGSELTDVFWVSKIVLSNEREDFIREFCGSRSLDDLDKSSRRSRRTI